MTDPSLVNRPIRSFVIRAGRMSPAQTRALASGLPRWGVPFAPALLDFDQLFGRAAPTILEIGCGMGETTAHIAAHAPETNFLGAEVHPPGVGALLKQIDAQGLQNLRVVQHDAVALVREMIPPNSLAGVHVFFPDPWHKKRHHKRRIIQPDFVALLASRIQLGGYVHLATDWQEYALHMLDVLRAEPSLGNRFAEFADRPAYRPETKFERRGLKLGHGVWDLVFERR